MQHFPFALAKSVFEKVTGLIIRNGSGFVRTFLDVGKSEIRTGMFRQPFREDFP